MYCVRWQPSACLGIENGSPTQVNSALVSSVQPGSAAELAGLRPDDQILAINGRQLEDLEPFYRIVSRGKPRDSSWAPLPLSLRPRGLSRQRTCLFAST
jgi:S1-C subfamily serine protease